MSTAILYRMGHGVAGDITRQSQATIEPQILGATPFPAYGRFGKMVTGKFVPIGAGDTADDVYGLLVRPYPTQGANASDPIGTAVPPTTGLADVLRRGYVAVHVASGTPAHGTGVFIRLSNGAIEAAADGVNTIQVDGAIFMSGKDAKGIAEIAFNI